MKSHFQTKPFDPKKLNRRNNQTTISKCLESMIRFHKKLASFLGVYILTLIVMDMVLPYYYGNHGYMDKFHEFNRHPNQYNAVAFGSSRIYRGFDPTQISLLTNGKIRFYNFGTDGTIAPESYYLYEKFVQQVPKGSIELAIVEISNLNPIQDKNIGTTRGSYWITLENLIFSYQYIQNTSDLSYTFGKYLKQYYHKLVDITKIKSGIRNMFFVNKPEGIHGYYPYELDMQNTKNKERKVLLQNKSQELRQDSTYFKEVKSEVRLTRQDHSHSVNKAHLNKLRYLTELSKTKNIDVYYLIMPGTGYGLNQSDLYPLLSSTGIQIIDMSNPDSFGMFYENELYFDRSHLNMTGSRVFAKQLLTRLTGYNQVAK